MVRYACDRQYHSKNDNFWDVLAAVTKNGLALQFASERLHDDERIVRAAVRENGNALQYASYSMKDNEVIVYEAITNTKHRVNLAFSYVSRRLKECEYLQNIPFGYTKYPRFR